jgi:hypothetical protein
MFAKPSIRRAARGAIVAATFATAAFAAGPAAPTVTSGADIKQLQFDWNYVPRANYYELWQRANGAAAPAKFGERPSWNPNWDSNISAHLLDWNEARCWISSCNPSGCTPSPQISVQSRMFETIGYFKPSATYPSAYFGSAVAISEDGATIASVAPQEPVNGTISTRVHVYRKVNGAWLQEARFFPNANEGGNGEEPVISLSGNGNVMLLGLPLSQRGEDDWDDSGAAYVFRRAGGTGTWTQSQRIDHPEGSGFDAYLGNIDEAGDTLVIGGQAGDGRIYEYTNGSFQLVTTVADHAGLVCPAMRLSGDGRALVRACHTDSFTNFVVQVYRGPSWTLAESVAVTPSAGEYVFRDITTDYTGSFIAAGVTGTGFGAGTGNSPRVFLLWHEEGELVVGDTLGKRYWNPDPNAYSAFGRNVVLSRNGEYLAVSDEGDASQGHGVQNLGQAVSGPAVQGAVYVFQRRTAAPPYYYGYGIRRILKPNAPNSPTSVFTRLDLSFGQAGKALIIGQPNERSAATGIDGNRNDASKVSAGALWLY